MCNVGTVVFILRGLYGLSKMTISTLPCRWEVWDSKYTSYFCCYCHYHYLVPWPHLLNLAQVETWPLMWQKTQVLGVKAVWLWEKSLGFSELQLVCLEDMVPLNLSTALQSVGKNWMEKLREPHEHGPVWQTTTLITLHLEKGELWVDRARVAGFNVRYKLWRLNSRKYDRSLQR